MPRIVVDAPFARSLVLVFLLALAFPWSPARNTALGNYVAGAMAQRTVVPIEKMRLGQRTIGTNPRREEVATGLSDPDPATWREVRLRLIKQNGGLLSVEFLRHLDWLEFHEAKVGGKVFLDLPEMGAVGDAEVTYVGPCPPIQPGAGNVVTGRFIHSSGGDLVNVQLAGQHELTGVTSNHPYWSVDRNDFIPAGELRAGERVDTLYGETTVVAVTPRPLDEPVYNLEIHGEHVYRVGSLGALVHNECAELGLLSAINKRQGGVHWEEWRGKFGIIADPTKYNQIKDAIDELIRKDVHIDFVLDGLELGRAGAQSRNLIAKDIATAHELVHLLGLTEKELLNVKFYKGLEVKSAAEVRQNDGQFRRRF